MDHVRSNEEEIDRLSDRRLTLAEDYVTKMQELGCVRGELKIILSTKIREYQKEKKNLGIETAELFHINESGQGIREDYKRREELEHECKALLVLIDAIRDRVIALQSIEKNNKQIV